MDSIKHYIYMIKPTRPNMINQMTPEEEAIIDKHFDYLKKAFDEGKLILAGPCLDGVFGIVIIKAETQGIAADFMNNDPAVADKVMSGELHPFKISLGREDF